MTDPTPAPAPSGPPLDLARWLPLANTVLLAGVLLTMLFVLLKVAGPSSPPSPPTPSSPVVPIPPPVVDPLKAAVQAAYTADKSESKKIDAETLAEIYRQAAESTLTTAATDSELQSIMHAAAARLIGERLAGVRRVLADHINVAMKPAPGKPLDAERRKVYADIFRQIVGLLEGLK